MYIYRVQKHMPREPVQCRAHEIPTTRSDMSDFAALSRWMEAKHKGYKCKLVSRDIPGEFDLTRMGDPLCRSLIACRCWKRLVRG